MLVLSRLEAIQDIRVGRGVSLSFIGTEEVNGRPHTFSVTLKRNGKRVCATIQCDAMRRSYRVHLTTVQVMSFIKLHYARKLASVNVQPISFRKVA